MKVVFRTVLTLLLTISLIAIRFYGFASEMIPPEWRNQEQNKENILPGEYVVLQAEAKDSVSLYKAVLSTNETGVWKNLTASAFLWRQDKVFGWDNFGTATYEDGVLYAPSKSNEISDGKVYAINGSNGNIIWSTMTVRGCDASPYIDDYVVYVAEGFSVLPPYAPLSNPKVFALNKSNGEVIWSYTEPHGYAWVGSPLVHGDYLYVTTGYRNYEIGFSDGYGIYALNKTNGQPIWNSTEALDDIVVCSTAYDQGVIFISGSNYTNPQGQYALNATNGDIIWHVSYGASWDSSPVIYDGMVIQVIREYVDPYYLRTTFVFNQTNGQLLRKFPDKGATSTPLVYDDKIFIPDDDTRIYAFNLKTGEELWHTPRLHDGSLQNMSYCSPAGAGGAIYYQSLNGTFYIIDETDGNILWSYVLGSQFTTWVYAGGFGSPSIGDGNVFITNDNALYAFRIGPGSGDWKMYCQNELHTAYSTHGIEYLRWPLTQPQYLGNVTDMWKTVKFIWCNKTVRGTVAWKIYFYDSAGNVNATDTKIFHIKATADLNQDGVINILDISIVAIAFGTKEGDENYNALADLDENSEVNILDVSIVAMDYGKTV